MTIKFEKTLREFNFWGGAETIARNLTDEELDTIEYRLESIYPDGLSATTLNDMFAFYFDESVGIFIGETEESILDR